MYLDISSMKDESLGGRRPGQCLSKKMLHQVTGHAGQELMADTVKYYGVNVTGIVTKCLSCSLEKIR